MNSLPLAYISSIDKYEQLKSLLNKDWAMLLDSGTDINHSSNAKAKNYRHYDIFVCKPSVQLISNKDHLLIHKAGQKTEKSNLKPFIKMRALLKEYSEQVIIKQTNLPFNGGWMGYICYDYKGSPYKAKELEIPSIKMGLYQWAIISDHMQKTSTLYNFGLSDYDWLQLKQEILPLLQKTPKQNSQTNSINFSLVKPFKSNLTYQEYTSAFKKIKGYIYAGDCYQVNFSQRFKAAYVGDPFEAYSLLAKENNSPFSAYLNFCNQQIMSLSPERFIQSQKRQITAQPIKGTLPRDLNPEKDQLLAKQLLNSSKDKAENLMIVDLLRNDLSKTASKGSVKVTELFGHYQFESVHHLISTVNSKLNHQFDNFDLLSTTLPGGSITGAPKVRAMQIIDELEKNKRNIYCGVIGYIDFEGNMDTNICIRSLITDKNNIYCWAGGGLVADSQLESEYKETFDKLNKILPILNDTISNDKTNKNNQLMR